MTKTLKTPTLENLGSLITYKDEDGTDRCLGYLMDFGPERGVFDANFGKVEVTKEQADTHNKLLDEAELKGLDANCEVGMGGSFYFRSGNVAEVNRVTTFLGTLVSDSVRVERSGHVTFVRADKTYRGKLRKDQDLFNFKRTA